MSRPSIDSSEAVPDAAHARAREAAARLAPAESRALGALAVLGALAILWVIVPVGVGVLLGAVLAFTAYPAYRKLAHKTGRPALAAALITAGTTLTVVGVIGVLVYLLVRKGMVVVAAIPPSLAPGGPAERLMHHLEEPLRAFGLKPGSMTDRVQGLAGNLAGAVASRAAEVSGAVASSMLALVFMTVTMFFVSRHWTELGHRAEGLMPINPRHTRRLVREAQRLGRTVVIGNFGTAIAQGLVAGLGFAVARVPEAGFLGAMTAVTSLVPVVGTLVVWIPTSLILLMADRSGAAIFVFVWGTFAVVGFCDYFVRPRLVGNGETMSGWMTLVSLFGGIELFGFVGILLGPMLAGMGLAMLRLYERSRRFRLGLH
ncbi:MAG TPA: AI-2E family transporter [Polyangiaceae bacterium]|nr:AI-2E family transporter [Polyangiaceae bacterium]